MEIDTIKLVAEAERRGQKDREAAAAESRRTIADAEKAAQALLEEARSQAAAENDKLLEHAEAEAAKETQVILADAEKSCQQLKKRARSHLDQAIQRILEGVVTN